MMENNLNDQYFNKDCKESAQLVRQYFWHINWLKTIFYNFKWLKFKNAIKLPFLIGYDTDILDNGKIELECIPYTGEFSIGLQRIRYWQAPDNHTTFCISGELKLGGRLKLQKGAKIRVQKKGHLYLGNRVNVGAFTKIICGHEMHIGNDNRTSWECQIFDTDFHFLSKIETGKYYRRKKAVYIGNNVFIGNSSTIAKGSKLMDGSVVSCCSKVESDFSEMGPNVIIKGNPASVVAKGFQMGNSWFPEKEREIAEMLGE